ncbi:MAG: hypothetical protein ACI4VN_06205 [Clostridia bacterium]|nr:hypothetical protein [Clostridia bacterium]
MKKVMTLIDEENHSDKYEIFCSFDSDMTGRSYVIYTGYYENDKGQLVLNAGYYEQIDEDTLKINRNLTHEENQMISDIMKNIFEQAEKMDKEKKEQKKNED